MAKNCAICIGINKYYSLPALKYATRDAEEMHKYFAEIGFDEILLLTDNSPHITDDKGKTFRAQPSFGVLFQFLRRKFKTAFLEPGDSLWFFFSGHGVRHQEKDYLMLFDSDSHGDGIKQTAIPVSYVSERLRCCGASNIILLLDACRNEGSSKGNSFGIEKQKGVITFASCLPDQASYEIEMLKQGSFTYSLLQALRSQNCATVEQLDGHLRTNVPAINQTYGKAEQTPSVAVEPAFKYHSILLPNKTNLHQHLEQLKSKASNAQTKGNLVLAENLWKSVLEVSPEDAQVLEALQQMRT